MDLRLILPSGMTASAVVHLSLLTLVILFSEVHPFGAVTAEQVPVEIVTPQEIAEKQEAAEQVVVEKTPEPAPTPQPDFSQPDKSAAANVPPPPPQPDARPQKQAALASPPAPPPQPQQQPAAPAYKPPEPDLSIKYQVLLGLPPELPPVAPPPGRDKGVEDFDAPATETARIANNLVAQFRQHLKTCLKLPASVASSDDVMIKLRVLMTPQGKLAAEPDLIEVRPPSMKGVSLKQGAISALLACQPYAMLPVDRYGEWKVLDLSFTPKDFGPS